MEVSTNSMHQVMSPGKNLSNYSHRNCLSRMETKMIKTRLRNQIRDIISYLLKTTIEYFQYLSNDELEKIVNIWNKKPRSIVDACFALFFFLHEFVVLFHCTLFCLVLKSWVFLIFNGAIAIPAGAIPN